MEKTKYINDLTEQDIEEILGNINLKLNNNIMGNDNKIFPALDRNEYGILCRCEKIEDSDQKNINLVMIKDFEAYVFGTGKKEKELDKKLTNALKEKLGKRSVKYLHEFYEYYNLANEREQF